MSRDEFLAKQAATYDSQASESKPISIGVAVLTGVAAVGVIGIYELVAFGFAKMLKRVDDEKSS